MSKLKPYTTLYGQQFTVLPTPRGVQPALFMTKRKEMKCTSYNIWNQKSTYSPPVSHKKRITPIQLAPVPIVTQSHSIRRCPICGSSNCVQNIVSDLNMDCYSKKRFCSLGVYRCIRQGKYFLKETANYKSHKNQTRCCHCGSRNIDVQNVAEASATGSWEEICGEIPYQIPMPQEFTYCEYQCKQCCADSPAILYNDDYGNRIFRAAHIFHLAIIASNKKHYGAYSVKKLKVQWSIR